MLWPWPPFEFGTAKVGRVKFKTSVRTPFSACPPATGNAVLSRCSPPFELVPSAPLFHDSSPWIRLLPKSSLCGRSSRWVRRVKLGVDVLCKSNICGRCSRRARRVIPGVDGWVVGAWLFRLVCSPWRWSCAVFGREECASRWRCDERVQSLRRRTAGIGFAAGRPGAADYSYHY